ncbi:MAG: hypothetical protein ACREQR_03970 [Candidatus Binataceae bacterium]
MNPEYQTLYTLSVIAVSATLGRVMSQSKAGMLDWIALGSLALLFAQVILLVARPSL